MHALLVGLLVLTVNGAEETWPVVRAPAGSVRGRTWQIRGTGLRMHAFLAIPYALPPTRQRRFQDPIPMPEWEHVFNGTTPSDGCLWFDVWNNILRGSEECLRLDIYSPKVSTVSSYGEYSDKPLTTLVILANKMSTNFKLTDLVSLATKNILLVVVHYRQEIFGFLTSGDALLPGNYGLLDQLLALQWIQKNIRPFGGDPNQVTLMGVGNSATDAFYLLMSPRSEDLFSRIILLSGNAMISRDLSNPSDSASAIGKILGCNEARNSTEIVKCLGFKSAEELVRAGQQLQRESKAVYMKPVIDKSRKNPVLPEGLDTLQKVTESRKSVPMLMGFTAQRGRESLLEYFMQSQGIIPPTLDSPSILSLALRDLVPYDNLQDVIQTFYSRGGCPIEETIKALTDVLYYYPAEELGKFYSKIAPVYFFIFTYRRHSSRFIGGKQDQLHLSKTIQQTLESVVTDDDLLESLFNGQTQQLDDRVVTDLVSTLWANFAKEGKPIKLQDRLPEWTPYYYSQYEIKYYNISLEPTIHVSLRPQELNFWDAIRSLQFSPKTTTTTITTTTTTTVESHLHETEQLRSKNTNFGIGYFITTWIFFNLTIFFLITTVYFGGPILKTNANCQKILSRCFPHLYQQQQTEV